MSSETNETYRDVATAYKLEEIRRSILKENEGELNPTEQETVRSSIFNIKIDLLLSDIDNNVNKLISFIKKNYKGNERKLRELFLIEIGSEDFQLNFYNNDELLRFLNAKILFGDINFLQDRNTGIGYNRDPKTGNFIDRNGKKLIIFSNTILSTSPIIRPINKENITINYSSREYYLEYIGSNKIYITIGNTPYGEYYWDKKRQKYILQDHKDGNKPLKIKRGLEYTITKKDQVIDEGYETLISNKELNQTEIENLYSRFTQKERHIEKIKKQILQYIITQITNNDLMLSDDEYIFFIEKTTQRNFLIHYSGGYIRILGYDKISTGNPKRSKKYFETPDLIIDRTKGVKPIYSGDWRAEGTNSKGYGDEGSKIFYLGKYHIDKSGNAYIVKGENKNGKGYIINKKGQKIPAYVNFHFAMHKTTPWATTQLGRKLSHGCVRMTPFSIDLLDKQGLLNGIRGKYIIVGNYK